LDADILNHLKSLHMSSVDARNGYQEALEDADGKGMTPLFRDMIALHEANASELGRLLVKANEIPDEKGSFMTMVHKTIMDIRSLFNGLDESVLPGLIDGENRNISKYDDILKDAKLPADIATVLAAQRDKIMQKVTQMEARKSAAVRAPSQSTLENKGDRGALSPIASCTVFYFDGVADPFSEPTPVSDDAGAARTSGAGLAG